jgi:NMD protein affecting ribosome stability and mRNA decay
LSLPDAIANVLESHIKRGQTELKLEIPKAEVKVEKPQQELVYETVTQQVQNNGMVVTQKFSIADLGHAPACPDCSNMLVMQEGCMKCEACGFSKCG